MEFLPFAFRRRHKLDILREVNGMREIRKLTEQDLDNMTRITINAYPGYRPENFNTYRDNFLKSMTEDSTIDFYGLFQEDRMVGSMRFHDFRMQLHTNRIAAGGVGMVAVDLLHKKEKVCKEMIQFFVEYLRSNGVSMALLYPFRPDFYKQMGFGFGSKMHRYSIPPAQFPKRSGKDKVRFLTNADKGQLLASYNRVLQRSNGLLEKSEAELDRLFAAPAYRIAGCFEGTEITGYMVFTFKAHSPEGFLWNDMVILDFFWENTEALNQLMAFIHSQADQISRVIIHTQDDNFHCLFSDPRYGLEEIVFPVGQQTNISAAGIMYRVTDIKKLFADLAGHKFKGPDCCLGLNIRDTFIPENSGSYNVQFTDGEASLITGKGWDVELTMDIAEFSSLIVGAVDLYSLVNMGLVELSEPSWTEPLNEVFRARSKPICVTGF